MKRLISRFGVRVLAHLGITSDLVDIRVVEQVRQRRTVDIVVVEGPLPRGLIVQQRPPEAA